MTHYSTRFPAVGEHCELGLVSVNRLTVPAGSDPGITVVGPNAFRLGKEREVREIVLAARFAETDAGHRTQPVAVELDVGMAQLTGSSYGLALAIADLQVLRGQQRRPVDDGGLRDERAIIATGIIEHASGRILAVGSFEDKLACIATWLADGKIDSHALFLYPRDNEQNAGQEANSRLRRLRALGFRCHAVRDFAEVRMLLGLRPPRPADRSERRGDAHKGKQARRWITRLAVAGASALGLAVLAWWTLDPPRFPLEPEQPVAAVEPIATTPSSGDEPRALTLRLNDLGPKNADLAVRFRVGGDDGKARPVRSGMTPRLPTGARYTLHISARAGLYLYIVHYDAKGKVRMLVQDDRADCCFDGSEPNRLHADDEFILPGETAHYELDSTIGSETFHIVLSAGPLPQLSDRYRAVLHGPDQNLIASTAPEPTLRGALRRIPVFGNPRGANIGADPTSHEPLPAPAQTDMPQAATANDVPLMHCLAPDGACRGIFVIKHIARSP